VKWVEMDKRIVQRWLLANTIISIQVQMMVCSLVSAPCSSLMFGRFGKAY